MKKRNSYVFVLLAIVAVFAYVHLKDVKSAVANGADSWLIGRYVMWAAISIALLAVLGYLLKIREGIKLEYIYPVAGLGLGIMYLFTMSPLSAPDEISHYVSAYQLSSKMIGAPSNDRYGRVLLRAEDAWIEDVEGIFEYTLDDDGYVQSVEASTEGHQMLGEVLDESAYEMIHEIGTGRHYIPESLQGMEERFVSSTYPPVTTTPLAYVPQALGLSLGRMLGQNTIVLMYLGRLFNLLFFVAMTFFAMKRLPFGKEVLFGVGILPMTLHLASSFSYDVMILGCMFLFTAVCLDLAYAKEKVSWKDVLLLAVLMAVAGPCKMIYAVLMGLCLLIPIHKFGGYGKWILSAAVVLVAYGVAMYMVNSQVIATYAGGTESYIVWADEPGYSLSLAIHQPLRTAKMIYNTFIWQAKQWHMSLIGGYMGNLDEVLDVPYLLVMALTACLLALAFRKPGEEIVIKGGKRVWILVLCGGCALAAMVSMLIAWTPISATFIKGVQGRYFLPFLPVLLMALKNDTVVLTKDTNRSILYFMCCANGYAVLRLFSIVCMRL